MLPIYIADDIPEQLGFFTKTIRNYITFEAIDCEIIFTGSNPYDLLDACKNCGKTALYFLDIDFKMDINGLELAREIRKYDPRGFIVFMTTHIELCYMTFSYKVEALDFILKDDAANISDRLCKCVRNAYEKYLAFHRAQNPIPPLKLGEREIVIDPLEIVFCEVSKNSHKVILHKEHGIIELTAQMKDLEQALGKQFVRCHRSYLINIQHISKIDREKKIITFHNGETCQISHRKMNNLPSIDCDLES